MSVRRCQRDEKNSHNTTTGTQVSAKQRRKHSNKENEGNCFVADLLTAMKDYNSSRALRSFLADSFTDQANLAATSRTAFSYVSKAYLNKMTLSQVHLPRQRLHIAKRIFWPAVSEVEFFLEPCHPKLPAQHISENARGLNPTCIKVHAFTSQSEIKAGLIVARVKAQQGETPPDDLLAARVYAKYGEVSADVALEALDEVEWDEELAMYSLLAENTAEEEQAVDNLCLLFSIQHGVMNRAIVRAAIVKHETQRRAFDYIMDLATTERTLPEEELSRLAEALEKSSGGQSQILHLHLDTMTRFSCFNITSRGVLTIVQNFRYLRTLRFSTDSALDTATMQALADECPRMDTICIRCPNSNGPGLVPLSRLKHLRTLALISKSSKYHVGRDCQYVALLAELRENQLHHIHLDCLITNEAAALVARQHGSLRTLKLINRSVMTPPTSDGTALIPLVSKFPQHLRCLELDALPINVDVDSLCRDVSENAFPVCNKLVMKCRKMPYRALQSWVRACGALEELHIWNKASLEDARQAASLFKSCRERLRTLSLSISDLFRYVITLADLHFPKLEMVSLSDRSSWMSTAAHARETTRVTTHFLQKHRQTLRGLELGEFFAVSDELVEVIARTVPRLQTLSLKNQGPLLITDHGLRVISRSMFQLKDLTCDFTQEYHITNKGITALASLAHNYKLSTLKFIGFNLEVPLSLTPEEEGRFPAHVLSFWE